MTRNLKALGIALLAALALSAMAASAAFAAPEFHSEVEQGEMTGEQVGSGAFTAGGSEIRCEATVYSGVTEEKTESEITLKPPATATCTAFGLSTHVAANGCSWRFAFTEGPDKTANGTPFYTLSPVLECVTEQKIAMTPTFFGSSVCTVSIGSQDPNGHIDLERTGEGKTTRILVTSTIEGVIYNVSGGGGLCGSVGEHSDGVIDGQGVLRGYKDQAHTEHAAIWAE